MPLLLIFNIRRELLVRNFNLNARNINANSSDNCVKLKVHKE